MAGPQLENGYTRIANELVERFAQVNLSKYEWRVLLAIIRKTYGWNKPRDVISVSQLQELTGLDRRNVSRAKRSLLTKNIIQETDSLLGVNKRSETWNVSMQTTAAIVYRDTRPIRWKQLRDYDINEYKGRCEWCLETVRWEHSERLQAHHIVPKQHGGLSAPGSDIARYEEPNVAFLCRRCHAKSHSKLDEWMRVHTDDLQGWYRHFVSMLSSIQTHYLSSTETQKVSSIETGQKKDKNTGKKITKDSCGGGEAPPAPARKSNGKKEKEPGRTKETWAAYAAAYLRRYGVEPVWNRTIGGQLGNFLERVPKDEAPHIAAYYVSLNQRWYVTKGHAVGVMLTDAEKLATEWRTNRSITETEARQGDQRTAQAGVWQRLLDEERAKHGEN